MTILCTIDLETREVSIPSGQCIAAYDHNVDVIRFQAETIPGFSLDTSSIRIAAQGPNKVRHDYAVDPSTVQIEEETGYITFDWPIPAGVTEMPIGSGFKYGDKGQLIFAVCAEIISGSTVSKAWHSDDGIITVVAHLEPESGGGEDPEEEATNAQKIGQLQTDVAVIRTEVGALGNGSPAPVATVAEMTDESAVYLYTGSETGYTAGNWYYYDGTDWTSGGTYGGAVTSTTFNQHGVPADDFAVGQALAGKADTNDVDAIDTRVTALESGSSGGLTADIKSALLACFANVAWSGNDGQDFYDALDAALNPPAGLVSISAVYTQSGTVYETSSLDSLKSDLVVTARYDNGTTQTITNYTLSGTLTEGTSTITVAFNGKTTTFNVTVSEAPPMLYPLTNGVHTLEDGSVLTITDNNHIKLEASANPSQFVNLYTCEAGTADVVNNKPVWFTLPASASTTLTVKDITKTSNVNTQFNLRKALSTASSSYSLTFNSYIADPTDKTYTPGSDENISCPFLYQPRANMTLEFTLELVVNGVRYI